MKTPFPGMPAFVHSIASGTSCRSNQHMRIGANDAGGLVVEQVCWNEASDALARAREETEPRDDVGQRDLIAKVLFSS